MKKAMMLAFAVLGISAAQALTVSWEGTSLAAGVTSMETSYGAGTKCSFVAAITLGTKTGNILAAGQKTRFDDSSWKNTMAIAYNDGKLSLTAKGATTQTTLDLGAAGAGNHKIAFTLNRGENNAASAITAFVDGKAKGTLNIAANFWSGPMNSVWVANAHVGAVDSITAYGAILNEEQGKELTAVVPEPTVLALLALGVAGIALKRKVA